MKNHKYHSILNNVPVDYYQKGISSNLFQKLWHSQKIRIAKIILKSLNFKNCLDLGCASGYMTNQIYESFPNARFYGLDPHDNAIQFAVNKYPHIKFKTGLAGKLPFKKNTFDLVVCYETIEHIENPLKALQEIKRVLVKKGIAIIAMDSGSVLFRIIWFIWERTKGRVWQGAHLHQFNASELENIIKKSGLKINKRLFSHLGLEMIFIVTKT